MSTNWIDDLFAAQRIVEEECDKIQPALQARIRQRIKKEVPTVKAVLPKSPYAFAARSGPKQLAGYSMSPTISESRMVMPVVQLEVKRD